MIKVGFIVTNIKNWTGGMHYMKNMLYAINSIEEKKIQSVLFLGKKAENSFVAEFEKLGTVKKVSLLDKFTVQWLLHNIIRRIFLKSPFLSRLLEKNSIDIISHAGFTAKSNEFKTLNWLGDFQHKHLPEMFSAAEVKYRDMIFLKMAKESEGIVLSSNDALNDYKKLYPEYISKAYVLQFVSQPNEKIYEIKNTKEIESKYGFSGKFFYLPNQFWKHKNHMIVLKALNLLKKEGKEILVLCTGCTSDYRNTGHFESILRYAKENDLENNVKFLGLIDYLDVMTLMRHCISIINPSLFEGWSSTVEEAKSIGKNMILSNLNVHIEQDPPSSIYFDPHNEKELAEKLWQKWQESKGGPDFDLEEIARKNIKTRTKNFGNTYQNIVLDVMKK